MCSTHLKVKLRHCHQQPSLSHVGCKTKQNSIYWVTSPCQTLALTTWMLLIIKPAHKVLVQCVATQQWSHPRVTALHVSAGGPGHRRIWFLTALCLHLSSPGGVSTYLAGTGEGDGDLVYSSAGPGHSLMQWWRCIGAKMLDYELWYGHTTFCAILCYNSVCRKYHEKHWPYTKPLLTVLELGCQSPYYWKRGIGRNTNHKPESFLLIKYPRAVQNQY